MLFSIALLLLGGMFAGWLCRKLRLPALLGMILVGVLAGPAVLDLIDGSILGISSQLRKIALIIILSRAGLTLNLEDLKKNGRPAVLMCFVPAAFEITGMILLDTACTRASPCNKAGSSRYGKRGCRSIACGHCSEDDQTHGRGIWSQKRDSPDYPCGCIRR